MVNDVGKARCDAMRCDETISWPGICVETMDAAVDNCDSKEAAKMRGRKGARMHAMAVLAARRATWNSPLATGDDTVVHPRTKSGDELNGIVTSNGTVAKSKPLPPTSINRSVSVDFAGLQSNSLTTPSGNNTPAGVGGGNSRSSAGQYETANKLLSRQLNKQDEKIHDRITMTLRGRIYNLLERPVSLKSFTYHSAAFFLVLICLTFSILSTMEDFAYFANTALFWMETSMVIVFGVEFVVRVWAAGCCGKYIGFFGRLRFIRKPICLIDLGVLVASSFVLSIGADDQIFATSAIRGIRFLQIMRMFRVDRHASTWRLFGSVVYVHRKELITTLYIGFLGLVLSSYFVFLAEKDVQAEDGNTDFTSFADALWWGVATFTTIGYGDRVPRTWMGRLVTSFFSLVIISFITLPAGILGSGFALTVQQKQRQKHFTRQFPSAALLIQCAWRCHAADKSHWSEATWKIHMRPPKYATQSDGQSCEAANAASNKKMSIVYRLKTIRTSKSETSTPDDRRKKYTVQGGEVRAGQHSWHENCASEDAPDNAAGDRRNSGQFNDGRSPSTSDFNFNNQAESTDAVESPDDIEDGSNEQSSQSFATLTEAHKNAIRAIRKLKYFVARRNFSQARKPYDVQDVIEQYSQGHLNMMYRIKELQRRLETTIGKPTSLHTRSSDKPVMTITSRLLKLEIKTTTMDKKLDHILAILNGSSGGTSMATAVAAPRKLSGMLTSELKLENQSIN